MKFTRLNSLSAVLVLVAIGTLLTGCGSSENASVKSDLAIRGANCQLIYDWIDYRQSPEKENFWNTQVNTYDFYALIEEGVFSKIKDGDPSYDTILQIRNLEYDHNLMTAPPLGITVTEFNFEQYRKPMKPDPKDSFIPEEEQWKIINSLSSFCNRFTADEFANEFAYVLVMDK
jgi:hypothetical protein